MIPLSKYSQILTGYRDQLVNDFDELIMTSNLLGERPNYFTMDERGMFHAQASGTLEECIRALEHHLSKLKKIQEQKQQ